MNYAERAGVTRLVTACRHGGEACVRAGVAPGMGVTAARRLALFRPGLAWLIRAMRLIRGSTVHRINRITLIHHAISAGIGRDVHWRGQIEVSGESDG